MGRPRGVPSIWSSLKFHPRADLAKSKREEPPELVREADLRASAQTCSATSSESHTHSFSLQSIGWSGWSMDALESGKHWSESCALSLSSWKPPAGTIQLGLYL